MLGGVFLMLSYFGCDQSQVQRYLTAKSVDEGRHSLLMSAYVKIPLQALVLLTGVLVFVFYLFNQPPMLFRPVVVAKIEKSARAGELTTLRDRVRHGLREPAQRRDDAGGGRCGRSARRPRRRSWRRTIGSPRCGAGRRRSRARSGESGYKDFTGDTPTPDVNYVFPTFVTTRLPMGLVGLIIAAIFAAAMSSIAAELNSLATASVIDIYRRLIRPVAPDAHYLRVSWIATGLWGLFACFVATFAAGLGSLIEVVNRFGSFFYGSLLGVFVLALVFRRANGHGAFVGLLAGIACVATFALHPATSGISFLWQNPLGVVVVVIVGLIVSEATRARATA